MLRKLFDEHGSASWEVIVVLFVLNTVVYLSIEYVEARRHYWQVRNEWIREHQGDEIAKALRTQCDVRAGYMRAAARCWE